MTRVPEEGQGLCGVRSVGTSTGSPTQGESEQESAAGHRDGKAQPTPGAQRGHLRDVKKEARSRKLQTHWRSKFQACGWSRASEAHRKEEKMRLNHHCPDLS